MTTYQLPVSPEMDDLLAAIREGEEDKKREIEAVSGKFQLPKGLGVDVYEDEEEEWEEVEVEVEEEVEVEVEEDEEEETGKAVGGLDLERELATQATPVDDNLRSLVAQLGGALNLPLSMTDVAKFVIDSDEEANREDEVSPIPKSNSSHKETTVVPGGKSLTEAEPDSEPPQPDSTEDELLCLNELKSKARQVSLGSASSLVGSSTTVNVDWGEYLNKLIEVGTKRKEPAAEEQGGVSHNVPDTHPEPKEEEQPLTSRSSATETSSGESEDTSEGAGSTTGSRISDMSDTGSPCSSNPGSRIESQPERGSTLAEAVKALPPRYSRAICAAVINELNEMHRRAKEEEEQQAAPEREHSSRRKKLRDTSSESKSSPSSAARNCFSEPVTPRSKEEEEMEALRKLLPEAMDFTRLSMMLSKATDEALEGLAQSITSGEGPRAKAVNTSLNPEVKVTPPKKEERERSFSDPTYTASGSKLRSITSSISPLSPSTASPVSTSGNTSDCDDSSTTSSTTCSPNSSLTSREGSLTRRSLRASSRPMNTLARRNKISETVESWAASHPKEPRSPAAAVSSSSAPPSGKHSKTHLLAALADSLKKPSHRRRSSSSSTTEASPALVGSSSSSSNRPRFGVESSSQPRSARLGPRHQSMVQESTPGTGLLSEKERKAIKKAERLERKEKKAAEKLEKKERRKSSRKSSTSSVRGTSSTTGSAMASAYTSLPPFLSSYSTYTAPAPPSPAPRPLIGGIPALPVIPTSPPVTTR